MMEKIKGIHPVIAVILLSAISAIIYVFLEIPEILFHIILLIIVTVGVGLSLCRTKGRMQPPHRAQPIPLSSAYERLSTSRQDDGSAIVYPYPFLREGYRLTAEEFARYRALQASELASFGQIFGTWWNRSFATGIALIVATLGINYILLPDDPARYVPDALMLALLILAGGLLCAVAEGRQSRKSAFQAQFPDARSRGRDPKRRRKRLVLLLALTPIGPTSLALAAVLCGVLLYAGTPSAWSMLRSGSAGWADAADVLFWLIGLPLVTVLLACLAVQHALFRIRHGHRPTTADLDAL